MDTTIFTRYLFDINAVKNKGNITTLKPSITIKKTPIKLEVERCIDTRFKEIYGINDDELIKIMMDELATDISNYLRPSLLEAYSKTKISDDTTVHKLMIGIVLEDEKVIYDAKETLLKEMVEDGYRKYETQRYEYVLEHNKVLSMESEINLYKEIEKSFWKRFKFLFNITG